MKPIISPAHCESIATSEPLHGADNDRFDFRIIHTSPEDHGDHMIIIEKYLGLRQAADDGQASGLECTHESQKIECGCKPITERTVEEVHSLGETTVNGWAVLCLDSTRSGQDMRSDCDSTDYAVISTGLEERIIEEASGKSLDSIHEDHTESDDSNVWDMSHTSGETAQNQDAADTVASCRVPEEETNPMDDDDRHLSTLVTLRRPVVRRSINFFRTRRKQGRENDEATPVPPEIADMIGDCRVLVRRHFLALLRSQISGKQRKRVPWISLSHELLSTRRRLVDWPKAFAYKDGLLVNKLSMRECKRLTAVKIKDWSSEELTAYGNGQIKIPLFTNVDGECLRTVDEVVELTKSKSKSKNKLTPTPTSKSKGSNSMSK